MTVVGAAAGAAACAKALGPPRGARASPPQGAGLRRPGWRCQRGALSKDTQAQRGHPIGWRLLGTQRSRGLPECGLVSPEPELPRLSQPSAAQNSAISTVSDPLRTGPTA